MEIDILSWMGNPINNGTPLTVMWDIRLGECRKIRLAAEFPKGNTRLNESVSLSVFEQTLPSSKRFGHFFQGPRWECLEFAKPWATFTI